MQLSKVQIKYSNLTWLLSKSINFNLTSSTSQFTCEKQIQTQVIRSFWSTFAPVIQGYDIMTSAPKSLLLRSICFHLSGSWPACHCPSGEICRDFWPRKKRRMPEVVLEQKCRKAFKGGTRISSYFSRGLNNFTYFGVNRNPVKPTYNANYKGWI